MPPSPDAIIREWFQEVWTEGKEETIDRLMAANALVHGLAGETMQGRDVFKPFWRAFRDALSDMRVEVVSTTTEGEYVVAYCRVTGVHTGDSLGMPGTGRPIEITGFTRGRIVDGQIVEGWNTFDFLAFYQQLGLVPSPVA